MAAFMFFMIWKRSSTCTSSATPCHESRFAHRARNQRQVMVSWFLPSHQGTFSTFTPHSGQLTRRIEGFLRCYRRLR